MGETMIDLDEVKLDNDFHDSIEHWDTTKFALTSEKGGNGKHAGYVLLGFAAGEDHDWESDDDGREMLFWLRFVSCQLARADLLALVHDAPTRVQCRVVLTFVADISSI